MMAAYMKVCFIACHGGPADHFATYAEHLATKGINVEVHAAGDALKKFQERKVSVAHPFSLVKLASEEDRLAESLAKTCATVSLVMTDVGHVFDRKLHEAFAIHATHVPCLAYYDNQGAFVQGGYSQTAADVMLTSKTILFACEPLAAATVYRALDQPIDFGDRRRIGIGYYPLTKSATIAQRRNTEQLKVRTDFFAKHGIVDNGQKVLVYFGGNNDSYFNLALPAFFRLLENAAKQTDFQRVVVVFQRHPGAVSRNAEGKEILNLSEKFLEDAVKPTLVISDVSSDDAQVLADAACYYQTSMAGQFLLSKIPNVFQVGHETDIHDILIQHGCVPSVTDVEQLLGVVSKLVSGFVERPEESAVLKSLGIREDWADVLENALRECIF